MVTKCAAATRWPRLRRLSSKPPLRLPPLHLCPPNSLPANPPTAPCSSPTTQNPWDPARWWYPPLARPSSFLPMENPVASDDLAVSVIIPTLNEAPAIGATMDALSRVRGITEVIVVDGG